MSENKSEPASLLGVFHRVNRLLPDEQNVITVSPRAKVGDALALMLKHGFSQLPVVEGREVLGIFSFRSFSTEIVKLSKVKTPFQPEELTVDEFIEKAGFVRVTDELLALFDILDREDAAIVGEPDRIQGIVTAMDALRYLYNVASPFVLLGEIELVARGLIEQSITEEQLTSCVQNSLKQLYKPEHLPEKLVDITFGDLGQIICDGRNWNLFEPTFGSKREWVRARFDQVRELRNDVFHFRRELTVRDYETLVAHRDWFLLKVRAIDARRKENLSD